jgi:hypothetical protein
MERKTEPAFVGIDDHPPHHEAEKFPLFLGTRASHTASNASSSSATRVAVDRRTRDSGFLRTVHGDEVSDTDTGAAGGALRYLVAKPHFGNLECRAGAGSAQVARGGLGAWGRC